MKRAMMILLAITVAFNAYSQKTVTDASDKAEWNKIGETIVYFKTEKDVINVVNTDKTESLKIKVKDSAIHLSNLEVFYENGDSVKIIVNFPVKPQSDGRLINLKGKKGIIKKVEFIYHTISDKTNEKATVELWGLKSTTDIQ